mmetsp:Transcript_43896/g.105913  ORF Transcript_43896/g.105913 Transcript_43896/m.105913 type:complete len:112 (-) Transcript_43896:41-376(-)
MKTDAPCYNDSSPSQEEEEEIWTMITKKRKNLCQFLLRLLLLLQQPRTNQLPVLLLGKYTPGKPTSAESQVRREAAIFEYDRTYVQEWKKCFAWRLLVLPPPLPSTVHEKE